MQLDDRSRARKPRIAGGMEHRAGGAEKESACHQAGTEPSLAHVSVSSAQRKQQSRGLKRDAKFHFRLGEEGGRDFMGVIEDRIRKPSCFYTRETNLSEADSDKGEPIARRVSGAWPLAFTRC